MKNQPMSFFIKIVSCLSFLLMCATSLQAEQQQPSEQASKKQTTKAVIKTNVGLIELDLYDARTPKTVSNFISYAKTGFYDGTLFHRVIPNFMVQGGGFDKAMRRKPTQAPIKNEANAFIPNLRGTISMARTNDPHSATSQFFINVKDNTQLNKSGYSAGYAVFGKVTKGMDIADKISKVSTKAQGHMRDIPVDPIVIQTIEIIDQTETAADQKAKAES